MPRSYSHWWHFHYWDHFRCFRLAGVSRVKQLPFVALQFHFVPQTFQFLLLEIWPALIRVQALLASARGRDTSFPGDSEHGIHIGHGALGERKSRSNLHQWCFIFFTWNGLFFTHPPHACSLSRPYLIVLRTRWGCVDNTLVLICFVSCMSCWRLQGLALLPRDGKSCMGLLEDNGPEFPALGNLLSWNLKSYRLWQ